MTGSRVVISPKLVTWSLLATVTLTFVATRFTPSLMLVRSRHRFTVGRPSVIRSGAVMGRPKMMGLASTWSGVRMTSIRTGVRSAEVPEMSFGNPGRMVAVSVHTLLAMKLAKLARM